MAKKRTESEQAAAKSENNSDSMNQADADSKNAAASSNSEADESNSAVNQVSQVGASMASSFWRGMASFTTAVARTADQMQN